MAGIQMMHHSCSGRSCVFIVTEPVGRDCVATADPPPPLPPVYFPSNHWSNDRAIGTVCFTAEVHLQMAWIGGGEERAGVLWSHPFYLPFHHAQKPIIINSRFETSTL